MTFEEQHCLGIYPEGSEKENPPCAPEGLPAAWTPPIFPD